MYRLCSRLAVYSSFFFNEPATTEIYTLSLHDALPIWCWRRRTALPPGAGRRRSWRCQKPARPPCRSEEHTSELQSLTNLVCRLLLEKKKKKSRHPSHLLSTRTL